MLKIFSSSPFDQDVEKATSELNTKTDWGKILEICDKVLEKPNGGARDCLRSILKRLHSHNPHQSMHALTLLDACVKNCNRNFHLELCSRDCEVEIRKILNKGHPKVVEKLISLMCMWSNDIFKKDPELSLIPSLCISLKNSEKVDFPCEVESSKSTERVSKFSANKTEEDDIAKAIELSLNEKTSSTLYPSVGESNSSLCVLPKKSKEARKVRALYDFEAVEENELTFKTGEVILVLDDSDGNWWLGSNHRGEGLFPSNFVSADLNEAVFKPEKREKSVTFNEHVKVNKLVTETEPIDESRIDRMVHLLHEADPTGERPDGEELLSLEECLAFWGPRIDVELENIDRRHASLTTTNRQLVDALNFYETLMREKDHSQHSLPYTSYPVPDVMRFPPSVVQQQQMMYNAPLPANYMPTESYQPITAPPNTERYPAPAGALPTTIPPRVIHSATHPHIPYGSNNHPSIPQTTMPMASGNFTAPHTLPSRDQNGLYYNDMVVSSMPPSSAPLPLPQQPMS